MAVKNAAAKTWTITPSFDLRRYSAYPNGDKPTGYQSTPILIDTDINWCSLTGGESNKGSYMSLLAYNIGKPQDMGLFMQPLVYLRDPLGDNAWHEVDNYRALKESVVYEKNQVMELIVQIGSLGGGSFPDGRALDVKITTSTGDTNVLVAQLTKRTGRTFFVDNSTGNDSTGVPDDITKPFRYLQYLSSAPSTQSGIFGTTTVLGAPGIRPYDTVVMRIGNGNYVDAVGYAGTLCRFRTAGHNDIHITAYPGAIEANAPEAVRMTVPTGGNGGICGTGQAYMGTTGERISVSRLWIGSVEDASGSAAPINLQSGANDWRVYCNELGPWESTVPYPNHGRAGGISGHSEGLRARFNRIRDIWCNGASENHGIYVGDADGDGCSKNWDMSYNWIHDIPGGNSVQWNNNASSDTFDDMLFYNNYCENNGKYSVNFGNSITNARVFNNVLLNPALAILRFDVCPDITIVDFIHNTCLQKLYYPTIASMVVQTWGNQTAGVINIKHNIFAMTADHEAGLAFSSLGAGDTAVDMAQNLFYDLQGTVLSAPALDSNPEYGDPLFSDVDNKDFTCLLGGAGIAACTEAEEFAMADDFFGVYRPQTGTGTPSGDLNDIGAMQGVGT